jgi:SAM-dependent methyltransferase
LKKLVPPSVISFLKQVPAGEKAKEALRTRTECELGHYQNDPMVHRAVPLILEYKPTGKILDVGCYTGWLYHYLRKPEGYVGVDIWKEAIEVAKEFAPQADFRHCNLMDMEGEFDTVWCIQIPWHRTGGVTLKDAVEKMKTLGKRVVVAVVPEEASVFESYANHGQLCVWDWKRTEVS